MLLDLLRKYNGFVFDIIQFVLGYLLFYYLGLRISANISIVDGGVYAGNDELSVIILILTVLAQPAGAFLLKDAIQNYMSDPARLSLGGAGFFFFTAVVTMHCVFFGMLSMDILKNIGFDYSAVFEEHSWFIDLILGTFLFILAILPTLLTCLLIIPEKKPHASSAFTLVKTLTGDLIISFSAFVFISIYWENLAGPLAEDLSKEPTGLKIIIVVLFFFLFLLTYLPPRLVFLATDYNRIFTWIRVAAVFFPFLLGVFT